MLPFAALPFVPQRRHDAGQGGGFLGAGSIRCGSKSIRPRWPIRRRCSGGRRTSGALRMAERRQLLEALDPTGASNKPLRDNLDRAYRLLNSDAIRQAVDITREPQAVRERYGFGIGPVAVGEGGGGGNGAEMGYARQMRGQNLLLARRLVEAGVPFVNVYDFKQQGQNWDAHFKDANQHKTHLLPQADQALSALIEDLDERGLLDSTLVVAWASSAARRRSTAKAAATTGPTATACCWPAAA